jgi:hypothetical protein
MALIPYVQWVPRWTDIQGNVIRGGMQIVRPKPNAINAQRPTPDPTELPSVSSNEENIHDDNTESNEEHIQDDNTESNEENIHEDNTESNEENIYDDNIDSDDHMTRNDDKSVSY